MKNTTILVVDDKEINRSVLREILCEQYQVMEASDGAEAIELMRDEHNQIDLVLLDIIMPKMDGLEVLRIMKEEKWIECMPTVIISSDNSTETMGRAYELGATDYITRPFDYHIVHHRVKNTLLLFRKNQKMSHELDIANKRYFDLFVDMHLGIIAKCELNITKNICQCRKDFSSDKRNMTSIKTLDDMSRLFTSYITDPSEAKAFCDIFQREALLAAYQEGKHEIKYQYAIRMDNEPERMIETIAYLSGTGKDDSVIGVLLSIDVSEIYIKNQLEMHLFDSVYESIGLIRVSEKTLTIFQQTEKKNFELFEVNNQDYESCCRRAAHTIIIEEDQELFLTNCALSHLTEVLEVQDEYFFFTRQRFGNDKVWLKKHRYFYLDERKNIIVSTIEDFSREKQIDILTGEYNRDGFTQKTRMILDCSKEDDRYSILFFNVKGFKAINNIFTNNGADMLIRSIPMRLRTSFLKPIVVARLEADHFLALVNSAEVDEAKLSLFLRQNFVHNQIAMEIQLHCGIYHITDKSLDVSSMCDMAKIAEGYINHDYLKPFSVFSMAMQQFFVNKSQFIGRLNHALENEEFVVYYQPIYDSKTNEIVSAEALVRWLDPQKGLVSPGIFIPLLEESGYVSKIDRYVEYKVRMFQKERYERGEGIVPISVNLSRIDFYDNGLTKDVIGRLDELTIPKKYIKYEITESSYAAIAENGNLLLDKFYELGLEILLDDFGSGYSSFSTLRDYKFDILKLDMGFVQQIRKNNRAKKVIQSIISMAHQMGMQVVAEGAEDKEQVDLLCEYGCDMIQGFYFSKPVSENEFVALLEKRAY